MAGFTVSEKQYSEPPESRERSASRTPLFLCASAQKQGGSSRLRGGCVFAHQKRENPIPLWEDAQGTLSRRKGSLGAASFGIFSRQRPRKVHPKRNDSAETIFQPNPNKNNPKKTDTAQTDDACFQITLCKIKQKYPSSQWQPDMPPNLPREAKKPTQWQCS